MVYFYKWELILDWEIWRFGVRVFVGGSFSNGMVVGIGLDGTISLIGSGGKVRKILKETEIE